MNEEEVKYKAIKENGNKFFNSFVRRKRLMFIIISIVFVSLFFIANKWRFDLNVERIEVEGNDLLPTDIIVKQSGVKINSGLYDFYLKEIEDRINKISYIKTSYIERELPSTLYIRVVERDPIALICSSNLFYIDVEKKVMPYNFYKNVLDLPLITGVKIDTPSDMLIDSILIMLDIMRKVYNDIYYQISEVSLKSKDQVVFYSNNYCVPIYFGNENFAYKLENLNAFWNEYSIYEKLKNIEFIDVRFNNEIIVKWKNKI
jgi:cell division protein FtsQ